MDFKKAEVTIHTYEDEPTRLSMVPFQFIPGDKETYTGADHVQSITQQAGWLGLQTAEFKGWRGASMIDLSYANGHDGDHVFEVSRNFNEPKQEGEWLWFPVMPGPGVTTYTE